MLTRACLFLALVAALLAVACSSSRMVTVDADAGPDVSAETAPETAMETAPDMVTDGQPDGPALTQPQSYVVHGQLTLTADPPGMLKPTGPLPTTQDFTMHVDPNGKFVVIGNQLGASRVALKSDDGIRFETTATLSIGLKTNACASSTSYSRLAFVVGPAGVTGTAMGNATIIEGDIAWGLAARLDFTGTVDHEGPSLGVALVGVDPLEGLFLKGSEPLPPTVAAHLAVGGDIVNLTPLLPEGTGVVTGFNKPVAVALRYETTYDVVVSPWADLVGNTGQPLPKITTKAAPLMGTEDGFEGATSSPGGARLTGTPQLPPISGLRSAMVVPQFGPLAMPNAINSHMTLRLAVQTGDTVVRFSMRPFGVFQSSASTYSSRLRVAVPGGAIVAIPLPINEQLKTQYTNPADNSTVWLGDARAVEAPLPAGAATEVVFDFNMDSASSACGGPLPPSPGYLIDDLRVE